MESRVRTKSSVLVAFSLMLVLISSIAATAAFASSNLVQGNAKVLLSDHHKPGHDKGNGNGPFADDKGGNNGNSGKGKDDNGKGKGLGRPSMFQPAPTSFDDFELELDGMALAKRDGRDGPLTEASVDLRASVIRDEGNHFRFIATGTVELEDEGEYEIVDAVGIIIFFKNLRGNAVSGLLHISGKNVFDEDGNDVGKFRLRALVMGDPRDDTWQLIVFPSGKLGKNILLVNMDGTIKGFPDGFTPPPGSSDLHHFEVSGIPSSIAAGSEIDVTVAAKMSNGTLLKTYENRARITDSTGTITPIITPRFQDGVFKGSLNITKAASSDKIKFTDVGTGKSGESNAFTVLAGSLSIVDLSPSTVTLRPNEKAQFIARGTDKFGNELSGLTFTWTLSSSNFGSIATAGSTANFTAASSISGEAKLNLTAASGGKSDTSQIQINPAPSQLDHFVVSNVSSPQTAGSLFQVTIRAVNSTGGAISGYSGPMRLTDSTGTLNMTISTGFVNGVWTGNANITKADDDAKLTASDVASPSKKGSSNEFDVVAGALHHFDLNSIANQTAGVQFSIVVRAEDAFGNLKGDYVGNVTLSTNDGASPAGNVTKFVPGSHNFTSSDAGQHAFAATMYNARENVTVTANGSGKSGASNEFDVVAAAAAKVTVSPTSATVNPGGKATFTAEARDSFGNLVSGADFEWSLNNDALGDLDEISGSAVEFTASSSISASTSGTVTAEVGTASGSAAVTVQV